VNFYRAKKTFGVSSGGRSETVFQGQVFCWHGHEDPLLPPGVFDSHVFDYYEEIDLDQIRGDVGDFEE